jgi:hypothetical protein
MNIEVGEAGNGDLLLFKTGKEGVCSCPHIVIQLIIGLLQHF